MFYPPANSNGQNGDEFWFSNAVFNDPETKIKITFNLGANNHDAVVLDGERMMTPRICAMQVREPTAALPEKKSEPSQVSESCRRCYDQHNGFQAQRVSAEFYRCS